MLALCLLVIAADPPRPFDALQAIAGEWRSVRPAKPLAVTYKRTSAGTVLVETYNAGTPRETLTVFHPDGAAVVATHYCAQGNQPRLRLESSGEKHWVFVFADATNLPDPAASHLVRLELELSAEGLNRIETYRENGKDDVTRLQLVREPPPGKR